MLLASHALALSPEGRKSSEELVASLKDEMKALAANHENHNELLAIRQYLRQFEAALTQESNRQISQVLEDYGTYVPTEKVAKLVESISTDLKAEAVQKIKSIISELEGTLAAAVEAVERAQEPEDLDKVIVSLSPTRFQGADGESYSSSHPAIRGLISKLSSARQFVTGWQDYLQASNSGDTAKAVQMLRSLSGQENSLLPRSHMIARAQYEIEGDDKMTSILDQLEDPDDMKEIIGRLTRQQGGGRSSTTENAGTREVLQVLSRMEKVYREHLAGLPVNIEVLLSPVDTGGGKDFSRLRAALLLLVLPRTLELPAGLMPGPGETVDAFLARAIAEAKRLEDTAALRRIHRVRQLFHRSSISNDPEINALDCYAAGQNQFAAGQYLLAVVSLQQALKTGRDLIPVKKAGELLESIRKDHPVEFEQGMIEFLTPRPGPDFGFLESPFQNPDAPKLRGGNARTEGHPIVTGGNRMRSAEGIPRSGIEPD
ncbi:MAG: hypothetical protein ACRDBP_04760 [Luteolibacter sp.]